MNKEQKKQLRHEEICNAVEELVAEHDMKNRHRLRHGDIVNILFQYKEKHVRKAIDEVL